MEKSDKIPRQTRHDEDDSNIFRRAELYWLPLIILAFLLSSEAKACEPDWQVGVPMSDLNPLEFRCARVLEAQTERYLVPHSPWIVHFEGKVDREQAVQFQLSETSHQIVPPEKSGNVDLEHRRASLWVTAVTVPFDHEPSAPETHAKTLRGIGQPLGRYFLAGTDSTSQSPGNIHIVSKSETSNIWGVCDPEVTPVFVSPELPRRTCNIYTKRGAIRFKVLAVIYGDESLERELDKVHDGIETVTQSFSKWRID